MPYIPEELKTAAFIAGRTELYQELRTNPQLRMVPIDLLDTIRCDLKMLGYTTHMRFRGPHGPRGDTLKHQARAFTVYIREPS